MTKSAAKKDFTQGPIFKSMLMFAIPIILATFMQNLYNTADTMVVGQLLDKRALSAVSSTSHLTNLLVNLFGGLSTGATVVCARHFGAKDREKTSQTVHSSILLGFSCGIFLAVLTFFIAKPVLSLMNTPELDMAATYMRIYFLGSPFSLVYNFGAGLLRAEGESKKPMYILAIAGAINITMNITLVLLFPQIGVACVAIATVASQIFSAMAVLFLLSKAEEGMKLSFKKLRFHKDIVINILRIGIPTGVNAMLYNIANIVLQSKVNGLGTDIVAGSGVASQITNYYSTLLASVDNALVSFIGQNMGARKYDRVKKAVNSSLLIGFLGLGVLAILTIPTHDLILPLFNKDSAVIAAAYTKLLVMGLSEFIYIPNHMYCGALKGIEKAFVAMMLNILFVCFVRIIWVTQIFPIFGTFESLLICYPLSWGLSALAEMTAYYVLRKKAFDANDKKMQSIN